VATDVLGKTTESHITTATRENFTITTAMGITLDKCIIVI